MIIYTCPECGGDLEPFALTSNPPICKMRCHICGWEGGNNIPEIVRIPYQPQNSFVPQACRNCGNHPSNGGSGICNCTLGSPVIY